MTADKTIKLHKTVFGDFASAQPGWIAQHNGATFMMRQHSFNVASGLGTYLCRIMYAAGDVQNTFVYKQSSTLDWFSQNYFGYTFELEGNQK
jgi:hypothetical protein